MRLKITTEKFGKDESWELFSTLDPAFKTATIIKLLKNAVHTIQTARLVLAKNLVKLTTEFISDHENTKDPDGAITCTRAIKILSESLKMLVEDVELSKEIKADLDSWFVSVTNELHYFFGYGEWICDKFSEMRDMVQLVYGYVDHIYGLELPAYGTTSSITEGSSTISQQTIALEAETSVLKLQEQSSLTKCFSAVKFIRHFDYDWDDFLCTEYPQVLVKLPLRVGMTFIKFE